jgi:hypothetical protein
LRASDSVQIEDAPHRRAGASKEAGLPTGDEPKKSIVAKLTIKRREAIDLSTSDDAEHMSYILNHLARQKQEKGRLTTTCMPRQ